MDFYVMFRRNTAVMSEILSLLKETTDAAQKQRYINVLQLLNNTVPAFLQQTSSLSHARALDQPLEVVSHPHLGECVVLSSDKPFFVRIIRDLEQATRALERSAQRLVSPSPQRRSAIKTSRTRNLANVFFRGLAESTIASFSGLEKQVKAANMRILPVTYLALVYFFTMISFVVVVATLGVLLYLDFARFVFYSWAVVVVPLLVFFVMVYYPKTEADTVMRNISYELPFATIHMTAIAGADIEPSKIFEIIAASKDYPHVSREFQKVLVMVRVYGYNLVTALRNVAQRTSNVKLAELFNGLAINISGGGTLKNFLEQKSENFLLDYKLERTRYIDIASTFMDIYISILIAAPLILMLMFIIMNVTGLGFQGLSITFLLFIAIIGITVVNILFLIILNLKQPRV